METGFRLGAGRASQTPAFLSASKPGREGTLLIQKAAHVLSCPDGVRRSAGMTRLRQVARIALLVGALNCLAPPCAFALAPRVQGVWLFDNKAAVEIYDCEGLLCGRIRWLLVPRNPVGGLDLDKNNPDPTLSRRLLCGLTIISGLKPDGVDHWKGGRFYNPDDGKTYSFTAQLKSADVMVARIYLLIPLFGKTKTLTRVTHDTTEGWC